MLLYFVEQNRNIVIDVKSHHSQFLYPIKMHNYLELFSNLLENNYRILLLNLGCSKTNIIIIPS